MIKLFKTKNNPLPKSSINDRVNANLVIRLKQYKDTKKLTDELVNWIHKHDNKLTVGWRSYVEEIKIISYREYCEGFYYGTLSNVHPESYKGKFKN